MDYIKSLISLTKTGIITGNVIAATGGFFLAAHARFSLLYYLATMFGVALVIASGCVFNNVIDADIDGLMERTKTRALVVGQVSKKAALLWSIVLLFVGFNILAWFTNTITLLLGAFGWFMYVVFYTLITKRHSIHSTLVGSFSGSTPPVMGYTAVTGELDLTALLLFLVFSAWQVPHTYAIAIFRREDYERSRIPLLPLIKGYQTAKNHMLFFIVLFIFGIGGLFLIDEIHLITFVVLSALGGYWLAKSYLGYQQLQTTSDVYAPEVIGWGKSLFVISIMVVSLMSVLFSIDFIWQQLLSFV